MSQNLQALLHLVDRGVEGRLLSEEGEHLKRVLTLWDEELKEYRETSEMMTRPLGQTKPKLQLPAESSDGVTPS